MLVRRVEETNRTRSAHTIHAQSTARETNHTTGTRRIVHGKVCVLREKYPHEPSIIVSHASCFGEWILKNQAGADAAPARALTTPALKRRRAATFVLAVVIAPPWRDNSRARNKCRRTVVFELAAVICARSTAGQRASKCQSRFAQHGPLS